MTDTQLWFLIVLVVLGGGGLAGWQWFRTQSKLVLKAAEYAGFTQNNFESFGRGRKPSPEQLILAIRAQPQRLGQKASFLAQQVRQFHESEVELLDNAQERLTKFLQAFEGDYMRRIHELRAIEPADLAFKLSDYKWCTPQLKVSLIEWSDEVRTWILVVRRTLNHWKSQEREKAQKGVPGRG